MNYTKNDLRKAFNEVLDKAEAKGYLDEKDIRALAENGIPIITINKDKGIFDALRFRFEKWIKNMSEKQAKNM